MSLLRIGSVGSGKLPEWRELDEKMAQHVRVSHSRPKITTTDAEADGQLRAGEAICLL